MNKGLIKKRLLKLKSEFEKEIKNIGKNGISNSLKDNTSELSSYDNHPADLGSETFERGKDIALKDSQKILLEKVHDAIINLEKGTYGICENCNKNIEDERLEAIPYTTYCIRCKKELEKDHRTRKRPIEEKILSHHLVEVFVMVMIIPAMMGKIHGRMSVDMALQIHHKM